MEKPVLKASAAKADLSLFAFLCLSFTSSLLVLDCALPSTDPSLALPGLTGHNWDLLTLNRLNAVLNRQRKKLLSSIRGHFLLLRYPSPTKWGWVGTDSWDLYQAVPISLAHFTSESDIRPTSRTRVSYNKILLIKDALKIGEKWPTNNHSPFLKEASFDYQYIHHGRLEWKLSQPALGRGMANLTLLASKYQYQVQLQLLYSCHTHPWI